MTVFSNTTPLFAFAVIERFDLLRQIHGELHIVEAVVHECETGGPILIPTLAALPWIHIVKVSVVDPRFYMLDAGERDTISAALDAKAECVLIDERLGRNLAEYNGLQVVGTLGTLLKVKKLNLIPAFLPEVRQLQEAGFWYHELLVRRLAALVCEA